MKLIRTFALAGALLLSLPAIAAATTSPYVVVYNSTVLNPSGETSTLSKQYGFIPVLQYSSALAGFSAQLTSTQVSELQATSAIAYVTPDQTFTASGLQALKSGETLPVGIRRVVSATTTQVHTASGVGIAVLDTGIDLSNTDLNAVSGINCVTTGSSAQDDNGHGTNVAGIIAAKDQGAGVVGVAPGPSCMQSRCSTSRGAARCRRSCAASTG
jgi:subtilisin